MPLDQEGPARLLAPILIPSVLDCQIESWSWDLRLGRLQLWELPQSLQTLHSIGFHEGRASLMPDLERANADADRFYAHLYNNQPLSPCAAPWVRPDEPEKTSS